MMKFILTFLGFTALFVGLCSCKDAQKPNVLFLVIDDLRTALGCYGDRTVVSPNIDQLASRAVKFNNAYVQQAICAPSRTSFLTSRRPDTTRLYDFRSYWRKAAGNYTTLPQFFKESGYVTQSVGKIFHPGKSSGDTDDFPYSWSKEAYHPPTQTHMNDKVCKASWDKKLHRNLLCPVNVTEQPGGSLPDIQSAEYAVSYLKNVSHGRVKEPFFLAVGFHKPHIPFKYPEQYLKPYPLSSISLPPDIHIPPGMPKVAWNLFDLDGTEDIARLHNPYPYGPVRLDHQYLIRQNYYASVSYMDDLVGHVLSTLDDLGLANNTIVTFNGDHGWALGEHQEWAKFSNFEVAVNVPMMVYVPGVTHPRSPKGTVFPYIDPLKLSETQRSKRPKGELPPRHPDEEEKTAFTEEMRHFMNIQKRVDVSEDKHYFGLEHGNHPNMLDASKIPSGRKGGYVTSALVEAVDLFPTLAQLAGLSHVPTCPVPSNGIDLCTEGHSFASVIHNVTGVPMDGKKVSLGEWKSAAFSQYPRPSYYPQYNSFYTLLKDIKIMGYTMRTTDYRYTEWVQFNQTCFCANWEKVTARELYMHGTDPGEDENRAYEASFQHVVKAASDKLHRGWPDALPPSS